MSPCLGGSSDFVEADTRFGLSGFWARVLVFLGTGGPPDEGQLGLEEGCPCVPESRKGLGISAAEICEPRGRRQVSGARGGRTHLHTSVQRCVPSTYTASTRLPCSSRTVRSRGILPAAPGPVRALARPGPPGAPVAGEPAQQLAPTDAPRALIRPRVGGAWAGRPAHSSQWVEGPSVKLITPSTLLGPRRGQVEDNFLFFFSWFIHSTYFQWAPSCRAPGRRTKCFLQAPPALLGR